MTNFMKNELKLLIFDLDGTLLDTVPDVHSSVNNALKTMELPAATLAQTQRATGPSREIFAEIILSKANMHRIEEFFQIFRPVYKKNCYRKTKPFPGIIDVLKELKGLKLAVASNKSLAITIKILKKLEMTKYFDLIVGPELVKHPKPAPDMITFSLQQFKIPPDRALVIGDTDNDILAAGAADVKSCFAGWGYSMEREMLKQKSDFYIKEPADIFSVIQPG